MIKHPFIKPFNIIGTYGPPDGNPKTFFKYISENLSEFINERCETYLIGDINVDYAHKENKIKYKLERFESKLNF